MFCLFKNSHLIPKVNWLLIAFAWLGALAWLNFTFIEKDLVFKVIGGKAILVDLLFGVPLVLMLAVVVYATIYWFLKLVVVYLFPQAIMPVSELDQQAELAEDPVLDEALQEEYGEAYWQKHNPQLSEEQTDESKLEKTHANQKRENTTPDEKA